MQTALGLPRDVESAHAGFADIIQRLTGPAARGHEMVVANSVWGQIGAAVRADFIDLIARRYFGTMILVDFARAAEAARASINAWVDSRTRRRICDLLTPESIDASTRLVLVSAVCFKGKWKSRFDVAETRAARFHTDDGSELWVPLMRQAGELLYMRGGGYQAVELDYLGADLSMLVLLPDRYDGLHGLEQALSPTMLNDCVAGMRPMQVVVSLPRFKIAPDTMDVGSQLQLLGMTDAFDPSRANFGGINEPLPSSVPALFLSRVLQKCVLAVDEEGTTAAAATAAELSFGVLLGFQADHPFLFAIRDRATGTILFIGRLIRPSPNA
jgi:serpin B